MLSDEQIGGCFTCPSCGKNYNINLETHVCARTAAPFLQAQPQPVEGELVDAMLLAFYDKFSESSALSPTNRAGMERALRVAADRLLAEPTKAEIALAEQQNNKHPIDQILRGMLFRRRACLSAKTTPEAQPQKGACLVDRDWLVGTVMLQDADTLQRIHDAIAHRVKSAQPQPEKPSTTTVTCQPCKMPCTRWVHKSDTGPAECDECGTFKPVPEKPAEQDLTDEYDTPCMYCGNPYCEHLGAHRVCYKRKPANSGDCGELAFTQFAVAQRHAPQPQHSFHIRCPICKCTWDFHKQDQVEMIERHFKSHYADLTQPTLEEKVKAHLREKLYTLVPNDKLVAVTGEIIAMVNESEGEK